MMGISRLVKRATNSLDARFVRYLLVGGSSVALDFLVFSLVYLQSDHVVLSQVVSTTLALIYNYWLNYKYVFTSGNRSIGATFTKYMITSAFNYSINTVLLLIFSTFIHAILSKFIVLGLMVTWNYLIYKKFIFK
jgi:putative flippase GtrA